MLMFVCKYCGREFDKGHSLSSHSKWCIKDPTRNSNLEIVKLSLIKTRSSIKVGHHHNQYTRDSKQPFIISNETRHKMSVASSSRRHTEETKKKISRIMRSKTYRRLKKHVVKYEKKNGCIVTLDSSWELALAKRMDSIGVEWERPNPIQYTDEDENCHNYFPDFYLPHFDLYLDPKNSFVLSISLEKIRSIKKVLPNLTILKTLKECENFSPEEYVTN